MKEESVDPESVGSDPRVSTATSNIPSTSSSAPQSARATKTSKASGRTAKHDRVSRTKQRPPAKRAYVEIDDHSDQDDASHDAEQNDADEFRPVSDGDDELLMGIEVSKLLSMVLGFILTIPLIDQSQGGLWHEACKTS